MCVQRVTYTIPAQRRTCGNSKGGSMNERGMDKRMVKVSRYKMSLGEGGNSTKKISLYRLPEITVSNFDFLGSIDPAGHPTCDEFTIVLFDSRSIETCAPDENNVVKTKRNPRRLQ